MRSLLIVLCLMSAVVLTGCGGAYGTKLIFNAGELYYTSDVPLTKANELGNYLVKEGFFDGQRKSVQIRKDGNTWEFRVVVKKGIDQDPQFVDIFKQLAVELSEKVFNGERVDVHMCDEQLKTLRVLVPVG
jgi:hypothetical protein